MVTQDTQPSLLFFQSGVSSEDFDVSATFDNRFGWAVEYAVRYLHICYKLSPNDRMTVVLFNRKQVSVIFDDESTQHYHSLLDVIIQWVSLNKLDSKSQKYSVVFEKVKELIQQKYKHGSQPKVILLTSPKLEEKKRKLSQGFFSAIPRWRTSQGSGKLTSANTSAKHLTSDSTVLGDSKSNRKLQQLIDTCQICMKVTSANTTDDIKTTSKNKNSKMSTSISLQSLSSIDSQVDPMALDKFFTIIKIGSLGSDNKIKRFTLVGKRFCCYVDESEIRSQVEIDAAGQVNKKRTIEHEIICRMLGQSLEPYDSIYCNENQNIVNATGGLLTKSNVTRDKARQHDALSPSPSPDEMLLPEVVDPKRESMKKDRIERENLAKEVLQTERTYVTNLKLMIDLFQIPLSKYSGHLLNEVDKNNIFNGLVNIYNLHKNLLSRLEERMIAWHHNQLIGDVFVELSPMFLLYNQYTTKYQLAVETFTKCQKNSPQFRKFLYLRRKDPHAHGHTLTSFMIMPVQRLPRYRMLLEGLIKHTCCDPDHPDLPHLREALKQISSIAENLNSRMHEQTQVLKLKSLSEQVRGIKDLIQPNRWLVNEFKLKYLTSPDVYQDCVILLFNDILIQTTIDPNQDEDTPVDEVMYDTQLVFDLTEVRLHPMNYSFSSPVSAEYDEDNKALTSFQITDQMQRVHEYMCQKGKKVDVVTCISDTISEANRKKRSFEAEAGKKFVHKVSIYSFDFDNQPDMMRQINQPVADQKDDDLSIPNLVRKM
ncbi:hypothetical protein AKO1_009180 [Acrasis kona]|uniref:DH domain-containing protein n=1 Tax=Acrasis kona TaxID=1008807 RepID=A0AAW2ZJ80_9EUKA